MLAYAGKGNLNVEQIDLNQLVRETCESMRSSLQKTVRLKVKAAGTAYFLMADSRQMRQVIVDLVLNAAEAIPDGAEGTITVSTADVEVGEGREVTPGHYVVLEVRDTGCGIDEETMNRIFDPFFSTKFTGRGMGLAAVRGFVRSSGGEVLIESAVGKGTCFRVLLPTSRVREEVRRAAG
jgi:signal transduction histidine kinase